MHEIFAQISDFAKQLESLLRLKGFDCETFLEYIQGQFIQDNMTTISYQGARVSLAQFERFILDNYSGINDIFLKVNIIKKYVDVDGDGYVDSNDLATFLKRY